MEKGVRKLLVVTLGALAFVGCAHSNNRPVTAATQQEYVIGKEDVLDVSVWRDADLSRVVPVRPDGKVTLPLIGELQAEGRTATQISEEVREKLAPYINEPRVVVIVREVNAPRFYVIGEVTRPGSYPLKGVTTVLQGLSLAGGANEFADTDSIVVVRKNERYQVSFASLVAKPEKDADSGDFQLAPGDTIVVP